MNTATVDSTRLIIAVHLGVKSNRVVDDARLRDLGADRLDCLELLMKVDCKGPVGRPRRFSGELIRRAIQELHHV